jgi:hypothetical protein
MAILSEHRLHLKDKFVALLPSIFDFDPFLILDASFEYLVKFRLHSKVKLLENLVNQI